MPETIVIAGLDRIGDMLFATGALALLRAARPVARIAVLAQPEAAAVLEGNRAVDLAVGAAVGRGPLGRILYARRAAARLGRALGTLAGARLVALRDRPAYRRV